MSCDNDGAGTSLLAFLDEVCVLKTFAFVGCLQLLSKLIVTDTSGVYDGVGRQNVLRMTVSNTHSVSDVKRRTAAPRAAFWAAPPAT